MAEVFGLRGDRPGDAVDGQVPGQQPAGAPPAGGASGEGGGRVAGGVQEVRGAEVVIVAMPARPARTHPHPPRRTALNGGRRNTTLHKSPGLPDS